MPALKLVTAATIEPVSLAEQKIHSRIDISDDDTYISALIKAARAHIEKITGHVCVQQTWQMALDSFPKGTIGLMPYPAYNGMPFAAWQPFFTVPIYELLRNPRMIKLPIGPLISVDSIQYVDANGVTATFDDSNYTVDNVSLPARIVLNSGSEWPIPSSGLASVNGVLINFKAGYVPTTGATPTATTPDDIKAAIKMLVSYWYENRETASEADLKPVPYAVDALIAPYKMWLEEGL